MSTLHLQQEHESEAGRTPLMKAARAGHLCTVQFLISRGIPVTYHYFSQVKSGIDKMEKTDCLYLFVPALLLDMNVGSSTSLQMKLMKQ